MNPKIRENFHKVIKIKSRNLKGANFLVIFVFPCLQVFLRKNDEENVSLTFLIQHFYLRDLDRGLTQGDLLPSSSNSFEEKYL